MPELFNKTRYSSSIPKKLLKEGKFYLIPAYYFLRLSFLAREGMDNSGSYHFADHIYVGKARGTLGIGKAIDKMLLFFPSSRSFKNRYLNSRDQVVKYLVSNQLRERRILSVPSGIPRELIEAASILKVRHPDIFSKTKFYCIDMDGSVLAEAKLLINQMSLENFTFIAGDAFDMKSYPEKFDLITSTGFGEFLDDPKLEDFYKICHESLCEEGIFITSATLEHKLSDYMMRNLAELVAIYRDENELKKIFGHTRFDGLKFERDRIGYQVFVKAQKMI